MTLNYVPAYLGTLTLDSVDISGNIRVVALGKRRPSLNKPHLGATHMKRIAGLPDTTLDCSGHVDGGVAANIVKQLNAIIDAGDPVTGVWQLGTATSDFDAGIYTVTGILTSLSVQGDAEGEYDFDFTMECTALPQFTDPTPAP